MALSSYQKFQLKKFIGELEKFRGRHTELVTVYVPVGYDLNKIINHLSQESGTASNIKSASTRKNVIAALEKIITHLRSKYSKTPEHGLVAFSGNVAEKEGQSDVRVWSLEPPVPVGQRLYRCDKTFVLDILRDMMNVKEVYGLVVMDKRDAFIALLKGKAIIPLQKTHSNVPGKMRVGGQSAARFAANRKLAAKAHYKKVAEYMKNQFLMLDGLKGILIGGPGPTKYELVEGAFITGDVKNKIIAVKDITYTDMFGLHELVDASEDVLAQEGIIDEKKIMHKFFGLLATNSARVQYGEQEVRRVLDMGAVDTLLLSENLSDDLIVEIEEIGAKFGTEVKIISTETREGVQLKEMGGIAAILRYEL